MYLEPYLVVSDRFGGLLHRENCMIVTLAILRSSDPLQTLEWSKCKKYDLQIHCSKFLRCLT